MLCENAAAVLRAAPAPTLGPATVIAALCGSHTCYGCQRLSQSLHRSPAGGMLGTNAVAHFKCWCAVLQVSGASTAGGPPVGAPLFVKVRSCAARLPFRVALASQLNIFLDFVHALTL